ncbi:MAG: hypothetical protein RMM53_10905, partial [Bacteroidia bacterium]|nr:hypothetical protein [Bacteroidia bacterium]MDW8334714.1 hypothetical protein [Bacteroidia bacterium]
MDRAFFDELRRWRPDAAKYEPSLRVLTHVQGGELALRLIRDRHPGEPAHIAQYRRNNLRLFTKSYFDKIFTTFARARNANDFSVEYFDEGKDPLSPANAPDVPGAASFKEYCTRRYPRHGDILNWLFSEGLFALLTEPNGLFAVMPRDFSLNGTVPEPHVVAYEAARVVKNDGNIAVVYVGPLNLTVTKRATALPEGDENAMRDFLLTDYDRLGARYAPVGATKTFWIFDDEKIAEVVVGADGAVYTEKIRHEFGESVVFSVGGDRRGLNSDEFVSFIDGAIDYWDEIFSIESDLQGAIKQHVYPEKYQFVQDDCRA